MMNVSKLVAKLRSVVEGRQSPAAVPICAHGKLEFHKEFLDHFPAHSKLADEYRQWVQEGWDTCLAGQPNRQLVAQRIVLSDAKNQNWLIGCLWPSRDRPPDSRRYFYTQFVVLPALRDIEWPFIPVLCRPIWDALDGAYNSLRSVPDASAWRNLIRSKALGTKFDVGQAGEAIDADLRQASQIKLGEWLPAVAHAYGSPREFAEDMASRMNRMQRSLDEGPSFWRLEIRPEDPLDAQITVWMSWFQANLPRGTPSTAGMLTGRPKAQAGQSRFALIIPKDPGSGLVPYLMVRPLRADDACMLAVETQSSSAVEPAESTTASESQVVSAAAAPSEEVAAEQDWPRTIDRDNTLADLAMFVVSGE
jgi:hypothetical protein